jgi:hypothetical protein
MVISEREHPLRQSLFILCLGLLAVGAASAKTPDGQPPSVETVCDNETGAAFGLCNAYCEAMDCDSPNPHASAQGCASVRANFERKTGRPMPCEVVCPCTGLLPLFADIVNGTASVQQCIIDPSVVSVITSSDSFALVMAGEPPFCSVNAEPPFVELTATEELVCRVALREAAEAQGVPCEPPE